MAGPQLRAGRSGQGTQHPGPNLSELRAQASSSELYRLGQSPCPRWTSTPLPPRVHGTPSHCVHLTPSSSGLLRMLSCFSQPPNCPSSCHWHPSWTLSRCHTAIHPLSPCLQRGPSHLALPACVNVVPAPQLSCWKPGLCTHQAPGWQGH